jgi:3-deoxy-manno-octulosonate cytidylyltransferase (CMP-KDO synthetase)
VEFTIVIPARFDSQRLPGKALVDIAGKPMVQRVYEQALLSNAKEIIVATDDKRIEAVVNDFGGQCCMTSNDHQSGTDRIQEVIHKRSMADDEIIVNVQGDEPLIPPEVINQVASNIETADVVMATLYEPIDSISDLLDPNIVKLVTDINDFALYFSRAPIPFKRDQNDELSLCHKRHVGIYAYRASLLNNFVAWEADELELMEKLEQLRALRKGVKIHVAEAVASIPPGVDTLEDLERTRRFY